MPTVTQTRVSPSRPTDWTDSLVFDQVDPGSAGVVGSLAVSATLTGTTYVESLEAGESKFTESDAGRAGVGGVGAAPSVFFSAVLGADDGVADFAGSSGRVLSGSGTASATGAVALGGTGPVVLPTSGTASIAASGPGNLAVEFYSAIGVTATLTTTAAGSQGSGGTFTGGSGSTILLSPPFGAARTAAQVVTLAPQVTGWASGISVAGFDPALGTLLDVQVTLGVDASGSNQVLDLGSALASVEVDQAATISLLSAAGVLLDSAVAHSSSHTAAPVSGATPAWVRTDTTESSSSMATLDDAATLAAFAAGGAVSLVVDSTGRTDVAGPGNFAVVATLAAGTTISVSYDYLPSITPLVDSQAYFAQMPGSYLVGGNAAQLYDAVGWKQDLNPDPFFDTQYYLAQNPDVKAAGIDPLQHFMQFGWKEGRDPSLLFSDSKYLAANPDVAAAGIDPLQHYLQHGEAEGRSTFLAGGSAPADPLVNAAFYDAQLGATLVPGGVAASQQAAYSFDATGWQRGLDPDAFFSTSYYLSHNPDVAASGMDPLLHYETYGWKEGRDPSAAFSTIQYLAANPDVEAAGIDPLLHYIQNGQGEGRMTFLAGGNAPADPLVDTAFYDAQLGATPMLVGPAGDQLATASFHAVGWQRGLDPDALFDTSYYLSHNPDVAAAHIDPLLHYETYGWKEGRDPSALFSTTKYLAANPDVAAAGIDPLLHYIQNGQSEGRSSFPV